jgi:sugar lactone lactonase YvrE
MTRARAILGALSALLVLVPCRRARGQELVRPGQGAHIHLGAQGPLPKPFKTINIIYSLGIGSDSKGDLFLGSLGAGRILRVDAATRNVAVLAEGRRGLPFVGTTPASAPAMRSPIGFAFNSAGDLFVADADDNRIRRIAAENGAITTVAGTGKGGFSGDGGAATLAQLWYPSSLAVTKAGDIYVADSLNHRIRRISAATGIITTVAGSPERGFNHTGVPATEAMLQFPTGVALDGAENLLFADVYNNRIWKLDTRTGMLTTAVGTGQNCTALTAISGEGEAPDKTMLFHPNSVYVDPAGNIFVVEQTQNARGVSRRLLRVDAASNTVDTIEDFGDAESEKPPTRNPNDLIGDPSGTLYLIDDTLGQDGVSVISPADVKGRIEFNEAEIKRRGHTIPYKFPGILVAGGAFPWPLLGLSGDGGQATAAQIAAQDIAVDREGNVYFSEPVDHRIRMVRAATGVITTVAGTGKAGVSGDGGPGTAAQINAPLSLALDDAGNLYFSDSNRIRRLDARTGAVSTIAGNGGLTGNYVDGAPAATADVGSQLSIAIDGEGGLYYNAGWAVERIDLKAGTVSRYAGTHEQGFAGDGGPAAAAQLVGMLDWYRCDTEGNLYISEGWSIRRVDARSHVITTPAGIIDGKGGVAPADGVSAKSVLLGGPFAVDRSGNIYININSDLWKVESASGRMRLLLRDFGGTGLAIDPQGDLFFGQTSQIEEIPAGELSPRP